MKYWIKAVGYGIPASIRLTQTYMYKGNPMLKVWYGRYSTQTTFGQKVNLILKNG
tara:strand:- start:2137 stop:2301 length:165 start_codon:yes stop_codon:yes gene_type:complete